MTTTLDNIAAVSDLREDMLDLRDLADLQDALKSLINDHEAGEHDPDQEMEDADCPWCSRDGFDGGRDMEEVYDALKALEDEVGDLRVTANNFSPEMIEESHFEEYARQLADDIGAIDSENGWPACHIDWEAAADSLKMDYTTVDFAGCTYYWRS